MLALIKIIDSRIIVFLQDVSGILYQDFFWCIVDILLELVQRYQICFRFFGPFEEKLKIVADILLYV